MCSMGCVNVCCHLCSHLTRVCCQLTSLMDAAEEALAVGGWPCAVMMAAVGLCQSISSCLLLSHTCLHTARPTHSHTHNTHNTQHTQHTCMHTHTHTCMHTHTHTHTCTHTHSQHTCMHACIHTHQSRNVTKYFYFVTLLK